MEQWKENNWRWFRPLPWCDTAMCQFVTVKLTHCSGAPNFSAEPYQSQPSLRIIEWLPSLRISHELGNYASALLCRLRQNFQFNVKVNFMIDFCKCPFVKNTPILLQYSEGNFSTYNICTKHKLFHFLREKYQNAIPARSASFEPCF